MAAARSNVRGNGNNDFVASVRHAMANDPGRMIFNAQVQKGFEWLDNYLDNILQAPEEPLLELVKTPGRKKDAPKKTRAAVAASSKAKAITTLSFEDENVAPMNDFQRRLLNAQEDQAAPTAPNPKSPFKPKSVKIADDMDLDDYIEVPDSSPEAPTKELPREDPDNLPAKLPAPALQPIEAMFPPRPDAAVELSMIAEDEEPAERSRMSVHVSSPIRTHVSSPVRLPSPILERGPTPSTEGPSREHWHDAKEDVQEDVDMDLTQALTVSDTTQHSSIAPSSPRVEEAPVPEPAPETVQAQASQPEPLKDIAPEPTAPEPTPVADSHPEQPKESSSSSFPPTSDTNHTTRYLLDDEDEYVVPLRDEDSEPSLARKRSMPQFTGLGVPSPLRKSTGASLGTKTPGPPGGPPGGKRTSWLTKAREAKALEGTHKRISTLTQAAIAVPGPSGSGGAAPAQVAGTKRKSEEMLNDAGTKAHAGPAAVEQEGSRRSKVAKISDPVPTPSKEPVHHTEKTNVPQDLPAPQRERSPSPIDTAFNFEPNFDTMKLDEFTVPLNDSKEGVMDIFKKTVLARVGKGAGKSLGGNAADELAKARAAAEARVAERHKVDTPEPVEPPSQTASSSSKVSPPPTQESKISPFAPLPSFVSEAEHSIFAPPRTSVPSEEASRRLSISELVSKLDSKPPQFKAPLSSVFTAPPPTTTKLSDTSTSTTPPNSPPPRIRPNTSAVPPGPVFTAPEPVFVPPTAAPAAPKTFKAPTNSNLFPFGTAFTVGLQPQLPPFSNKLSTSPKAATPLSKEFSQDSLFSDAVFDSQPSGSGPAWAPSGTQETEYTQREESQRSLPKMVVDPPLDDNDDDTDDDPDDLNLKDDDDSWPLEEKLAAARQVWAGPEDSMTWSTIPTDSDKGDTRHMAFTQSLSQHKEVEAEEEEEQVVAKGVMEKSAAVATPMPAPGEEDMEIDDDDVGQWLAGDAEGDADVEDEDMVDIAHKKPTVQLVTGKGKSRDPAASTSSVDDGTSLGFFGQAGKLVSSMLGGSKKGKNEPVKSIALAAAVAKKQKEEQDKKATRLKEMEARRQAAFQKKAEEEKAKAEAEAKRTREEAEKRKKEREENTGKRTLKVPEKKVTVEIEKKSTATKPPSKDTKAEPPRTIKPSPNPNNSLLKPAGFGKSIMKQPSTSSLNSLAGSSNNTSKIGKPTPASTAKGKAKAVEEPEPAPKPASKSVRINPKALLQEPETPPPPPMASELIDLPEPASEYSDSEDEDRKKFDAPKWATSPEVRAQLEAQQRMNPDDIFGATVRPLRMEEIFRTRHGRFRARTSSANWAGNDGVTPEESEAYARRMGYIREEE